MSREDLEIAGVRSRRHTANRTAVAIVAVAAAGIGALAACGGGEVNDADRDQAIAAAIAAYKEAKAQGADLSSGPCIAEGLPGLNDWVADIAHDPREDVDNRAENQCQRYRDGEASHFVELAPEGELIRAQ